MAKRGRKIAAIRAVLAEQRAASVKEIQAALSASRIKASIALINKLKDDTRRGRKAAANGHVSMDGSLAAKAMVAKLGSVGAAREALNQYAKLTG